MSIFIDKEFESLMNNQCDTCVYQPYCSEQRGQCTEYVNKHKLREEVLNAGKFILTHPELNPEREVCDECGGDDWQRH